MRWNPRYTALHVAAYHGREAVVALLLAEPRFTKLTAMTNVGHSALACARGMGHAAAEAMLEEAELEY